jgi:2-polyprenyl-3-methyl-5-hydroxy-6-metoxy-1,4-benzoquinol methylase
MNTPVYTPTRRALGPGLPAPVPVCQFRRTGRRGIIRSVSTAPKETSAIYGEAYQAGQVESFLNRSTNRWAHRVALANRLVDDYSLPRLNKPSTETVVVDVGCSIGTFAIEFAKRGFQSYGVDFDPHAITTAMRLAAGEGVTPTFVCMDVSDWADRFPPIDIAVCFDVFEHLHDDELGAFLVALRKQLSPGGSLVFHTFPTELDYVFFGPLYAMLPLAPFARLPIPAFTRVARAYADMIDVLLMLATGRTWRERQIIDPHCNVLSKERLELIFKRTGWVPTLIETAQLYPMHAGRAAWFAKQPICNRNLFGVANPK